LAQPFTLYVAGEFVTLNALASGVLVSGGGVGLAQMYHPTATATFNLFAGSVATGPAFSTGTWYVMSGLFKGATSWIRLNDGAKLTRNPGTAGMSPEIGVGGRPDIGNSADSRLGEVLLTAELSMEDDALLLTYLIDRWGIT
jgi:hypothetical protein